MSKLNERSVIRAPTPEEIERAIRRAHRLRSEAAYAGARWLMARLRTMVANLLRRPPVHIPKESSRQVEHAPFRGTRDAARRAAPAPADEAA